MTIIKKLQNVSLFIDTRDRYRVKISIMHAEKKYNFENENAQNNSQTLLQLIDKRLKTCDLTLTDIKAINVETIGGSFTGVRIGVAVSNCLGWLYEIPVNSEKRKIVTPDYAK